MMRTTMLPGVLALLLLGAAACGDGSTVDGLTTDRIAAEKPAAGAPSDTPVSEEPAPSRDDEFDADAAREDAKELLGLHEDELPDDVRIARRGAEQFMLTEDYVLGRRTVELDDTDGNGHRVVTVTVELPDGPETYDASS